MTSRFLRICVAMVLMAIAVPAVAQGPAPPPPLNQVPLDGLSALLLAAGAGYGAQRILRSRSEKDKDAE